MVQPKTHTILVVDDLAANRQLLVTILGSQGHRMIEAANGREGFATVLAEYPDLVITDVLMPEMDGYEFVKQLQRDRATRAIPVIFYTAHYGAREAQVFALSSGVSHILKKPVASHEVLTIVSRVLAGESNTSFPANTLVLSPTFDREHLQLLTDQVSSKAGDLRAANARLRALINIGLELASERDPDRLLHNVCAAAHDLFGATYVTLGIVDLASRTVSHVVTAGAGPADRIKAGDELLGVLGAVVGERRTVRGDNQGGDPLARQVPDRHPDVQSFVAAPLASPSHVYGWFCLVSSSGRRFSEEDAHLITALAGQVGRIYESSSFAAESQLRANALEREILERRQVESDLRLEREALRKAEERVRFALEAARVGIWDLDFRTGRLQWSEILESQYGLQPGTFGGTMDAFLQRVHPQDREAVTAMLATATRSGADFSVQHRTVRPDGALRWLTGAGRIHLGEHGEPVRGVGISIDVTDRLALEHQYQQGQKMEAIGRVTGGVAHDFNNLLTAILGYCDLLLADLDQTDQRSRDIGEIQRAGLSAAGLSRQLLALSHKQSIALTLVDVNESVRDMRTMLGRLLSEDVTIVLSLAPGLARIKADRSQIDQVILNLAVNARDAMPTGGTLTIATADVQIDDAHARAHAGMKPGPCVALTVTDTGAGMTAEVRARLFEPFFTTKEAGRGTGLGLATVHGIVTRMDGSISVQSESSKGTSFVVHFPKADAVEASVETPTPALTRLTGPRTVLVVEDAEGLSELTSRLLRRHGYAVLTATNAEEARRLFHQHATIDLILSDVVMPDVSGPDLARELVALRPAVRVVYMSGYSEDAIVQRGVIGPGFAFLQKPFNSETLARMLRDILGD